MREIVQTRKWYHIQWYSKNDTLRERKLINKLDLLIVPYVFLAYWVKYIDQANINNAYVSGMKEDLGFNGNELVHLQTIYVVGAVTGQIPCLFLFTRLPMFYFLPAIDILWGVFTLLQYRATGYAELMAYRFLVGWFEAAFFPAMHYVFGAWYRGDEIARRGGVFYVGLTLGTLTAGLIQAGASAQLDGVNGLAGWRWMYIICAIITIPVGILGYFVLPGTPDQPNRFFLNKDDIEHAKARLERAGHVTHGKFKWSTFGAVLRNWQIWFILVLIIFFWNAGTHTSAGVYLLWIKSLRRYSIPKVNQLGTIAPALGIFYTLFTCFASDLVLGPAWAITMACVWNAIGAVILTVWDVPEAAKWFAFSTIYASVAMSSVLHGWVNSQLKYSPAVRSFTLVLINLVSQSTTAWTPLLVFKTVQAPRFPKGYPFILAMAICTIVAAQLLKVLLSKTHVVEKEVEAELNVSPTDSGTNSDIEAVEETPKGKPFN